MSPIDKKRLADSQVIAQWVKPGERVLDLFCGLGNFTLPLAKQGAQVVEDQLLLFHAIVLHGRGATVDAARPCSCLWRRRPQ